MKMNELMMIINIINWVIVFAALILLIISIFGLRKKANWHPMLSLSMGLYTFVLSIRFMIRLVPYYELRDLMGRFIFFPGYFRLFMGDPWPRFIFFIQPIFILSAVMLALVGLHNIRSKLLLEKKYINNLLCYGLSFVLFLYVILWPIIGIHDFDYPPEMYW